MLRKRNGVLLLADAMAGGAAAVKAFVFLSVPEVSCPVRPRECVRRLEKKHELNVRHPAISRDDGGAATLSVADALPRVVWLPSIPSAFRRWEDLFNVSCIRVRERSESFECESGPAWGTPRCVERGLKTVGAARRVRTVQGTNATEDGSAPRLLSLTLRERPDFLRVPFGFVLRRLLLRLADDVLSMLSRSNWRSVR